MATIPSSPQRPFTKPWLSCQDQVSLLEQRGLVITDAAVAAQFLRHVNYYRFSGYCLAFEHSRHQFIPGTTFEQIEYAYEFDRGLRDLIDEALEIVELDLRTTIAYTFGQRYGPFGHTESASFFHRFQHDDWLDSLREQAGRSSELFVTHFRANYVEFPDLPIWMATEIMSFGVLSRMFMGMLRRDQSAAASRYGRQPHDLASWMHHLVYIRNLCAHHGRLWDRVWTIKPNAPAGKRWSAPLLPGNDRLFVTLLILRSLLTSCPTAHQFTRRWRDRVAALIQSPPSSPSPADRMGLTADWTDHPCWI